MSSLQSARMPDGTAPGTVRVAGPALERFEQFSFASARLAHPVYYAGDDRSPPLLLLPEIAGFSPGLRMFAERLIDARFRVYVPWLFGPLGKRAPLRNAIRLCVSREFANLRAGVSSPITTWLRALTAHISRHSAGAQVGAIGMCLTGAFAIPLIIDPRVVAAVAAGGFDPLRSLRYLNSCRSNLRKRTATSKNGRLPTPARRRRAASATRPPGQSPRASGSPSAEIRLSVPGHSDFLS
jgi:dienelactone hydrolase